MGQFCGGSQIRQPFGLDVEFLVEYYIHFANVQSGNFNRILVIACRTRIRIR